MTYELDELGMVERREKREKRQGSFNFFFFSFEYKYYKKTLLINELNTCKYPMFIIVE